MLFALFRAKSCAICLMSRFTTKFNKPKNEGVDDETGEPLVQRKDDTEDTVRNRLEIYHEQTEPLVAFYSSRDDAKYSKGEGVGSVDEIKAKVFAALA